MNSAFIPVNEPLLDGKEREYLNQCLDSGWISSEGPFVKAFEEQFRQQVGRNYGVAVCNGSFALEAAIVALGIGSGDEVILPTFTIISCAAAVVRAGAIPVVVDCDPLTWNMDIDKVEALITLHTKAIMVVHIYGLPSDMNPLLAIAEKYGLAILEDAAEAHGQRYYGKPCGSFGAVSTFSFYANKHVTTGEGGMVVTDDPQIAKQLMLLRNLYFQPEQRFVHEELGWNLRMTNLQAAVGLAQLERLAEFTARKRRMGAYYNEHLGDLKQLQLPIDKIEATENCYWVYGLVLTESFPGDAKMVMQALAAQGIGTRPFFWPLHQQPALLRRGLFQGINCPVAENIARRGFYLPSGLALTQQQQRRVVVALREVLDAT